MFMNKYVLILSLIIGVVLTSCNEYNVAHFKRMSYEGYEPYYDQLQPSDSMYLNPILSGSHPEPSVCRVGGTYYMVTASLTQYPSLPVYSSNDLVTWYHLGHAVNCLDFEAQDMTEGIHSPTIRYNKYNKYYYIIANDLGGCGTFIVKTTDPNVGWSGPIFLPQIDGTDPSIFIGKGGKVYIISCNEATHGSPRWKGHRSIRMHMYDTKNDSIVGTSRILVDGGLNKGKHPTLKSPKMFRGDSKYYLMFSECYPDGVCKEVMYESRNVTGPFKPCEVNPVFEQEAIYDDEQFSMSFAGYADVVDTEDGNYWAVVSGCRPMAQNRYMAGMETFLLPANITKTGQPVIMRAPDRVPVIVHKQDLDIVAQREYMSGNIDFEYRFDKGRLPRYFDLLRKSEVPFYDLKNKQLNLSLLPTSVDSMSALSFVSRRIQHKYFAAETELDFVPTSSNELAGLIVVRDERNYSVLGITYKAGIKTVVVATVEAGVKSILAELPISSLDAITLRILSDGRNLSFEVNDASQTKELCKLPLMHLTTDDVSDFSAAFVAMYATSNWGN